MHTDGIAVTDEYTSIIRSLPVFRPVVRTLFGGFRTDEIRSIRRHKRFRSTSRRVETEFSLYPHSIDRAIFENEIISEIQSIAFVIAFLNKIP